MIHHCAPDKQDFAVVELTAPENVPLAEVGKRSYTFSSGNMLLGLEALGKFQQMANVRGRMDKILESIDQMKEVNSKCLGKENEKCDVFSFLFRRILWLNSKVLMVTPRRWCRRGPTRIS